MQRHNGFASEFLVLVAAALSAGCGAKNPYDTLPVQGKICFRDGTLIPAARIDLQFISQQPPRDAKTHARPGVALVNLADGSFVISTYSYNDGLIPGRHKAIVSAYDENRRPLKIVSGKYSSVETTPLEIDAKAGSLEILIDRQ